MPRDGPGRRTDIDLPYGSRSPTSSSAAIDWPADCAADSDVMIYQRGHGADFGRWAAERDTPEIRTIRT